MSTTKFRLEIELGNYTMSTTDDVRRALRRLAYHARFSDEPRDGDYGVILDEWGNSVGNWEFRSE